jgi:uncharacterized protein (TIGR02680 family)
MSTVPGMSAEAWLAAAVGGGLPEASRSRWQPLRVGIVSLWEYDDAEFWFADGRLVLRGGNGAGKTKVLELTTLMLLRGEIAPPVLDPFGSQHRTMRYNLLPTGEADDPRQPADSGLGYAWVEFGRLDETGQPLYFVCGMGARARRGTGTGGVTTWHFVTARRPGKDFTLLSGGRAVEEKELKKIDAVFVPPSAAAYRARLASELFGLTAESYDNLTELLKQLRRPKLGERLHPVSLAETLRDALPPLAADEVTQLAEGWEHLDQLRKAVEQTEEAAAAVARFVRSGWRPWTRVVLRRRADAFASATTKLDDTTRDKRDAETTLRRAQQDVQTAEQRLDGAEQSRADRDTQLRELLESRSYQDAVKAAGRVEGLRREVNSLDGQLGSAHGRLERAKAATGRAREQAAGARKHAAGAEDKVRHASDDLLGTAEPAGLVESARRHLPDRDVDALTADHAVRAERFAELRRLRGEHANAERQAESSAEAVERAARALRTAIAEETAAAGAVERQAEALQQEIRSWCNAAVVARCPDDQVEGWRDAVAELTVIDPETGSVLPGQSVIESMRAHVTAVRGDLTRHQEQTRLRRVPLADRHEVVSATLADVRSRTEAPPPTPELWLRRDRSAPDDGQGAPLWRCVDPVAPVDPDRLARLEAALAASGLLDAWLSVTGDLLTADGRLLADTQLLPRAAGRPPTATLLEVLEPNVGCGVPVDIVRHALKRVGWFDRPPADVTGDGDWLAADGTWRLGGLTGRAAPAGPASYLGAAAREAARQRDIRRLEAQVADLDARLGVLDQELDRITAELTVLGNEERAIPTDAERALGVTVATLAERARRRIVCEHDLRNEEERHSENLARRDTVWARFAEYAGAHRFPLHDLDSHGQALDAYRSRLERLAAGLEVLAERRQAVETAEGVLAERERELAVADSEATAVSAELRQANLRLRTAEAALGADHREQLDRRERLETDVKQLNEEIKALRDALSDAREAAIRAEMTLNGHEERRAEAEQVRDDAMRALWAAVDAGLAEPAELPVPERRNVQAARELTAVARREITARGEATDEDRTWRRCFQDLQDLRQKLLPNRDARVMDEEDEPIQRVAIFADPASGWQAPHHAARALTARAREQQDSYDAEQQRVLTTLLGSTFIEHLKDRLDYAAHTLARINDQLTRHPTQHGHAVRILWREDPSDAEASAVVAALGRGYNQLGTERQDMVRSFLARKIDEARDEAADGATDWREQLAQALDYRRWLRLSLEYRSGPGGRWSPFDAAKHGAKSGGEKVVLLSQPLFAAAVVAYDAAAPAAPRWVWLDEAMTGMDTAIKASFMGLTVEFELDVMLTAHDEWCTYSTVPSVAVYDLARERHIPGVDALPYLWCGGTMTRVDVDRLGSAPATTRPRPEGLFAAADDDA